MGYFDELFALMAGHYFVSQLQKDYFRLKIRRGRGVQKICNNFSADWNYWECIFCILAFCICGAAGRIFMYKVLAFPICWKAYFLENRYRSLWEKVIFSRKAHYDRLYATGFC